MRARARFNDKLDPRVIVGEHGWWQACKELDMPGYDPFTVEGSNFNLTVDAAVRDPVSGTPAHRANLCEVRPAEMRSVSEDDSCSEGSGPALVSTGAALRPC